MYSSTETSKLVGRDCFSECEEPDGVVEVLLKKCFVQWEDVLVRKK